MRTEPYTYVELQKLNATLLAICRAIRDDEGLRAVMEHFELEPEWLARLKVILAEAE